MSDTNANSAPALPSQLQSDGDVGRPSSDTLDGQPSPKQNDDVEAQIEKEKIGWKASARHMIRTFSSLWYAFKRRQSLSLRLSGSHLPLTLASSRSLCITSPIRRTG